MSPRFLIAFLVLPLAALVGAPPHAADGAQHKVVLVVFDGMRPDFVSEEHTPNLARLARDGVFFQNHHAAFLTSTEVNGVALATGMYPAHSGVMANIEYRPKIDPANGVGTEALDSVRKGDLASGGKYLAVATFVETLQRAGKSTLVAGSKPIAMLFDRTERSDRSHAIDLFEGKSLPATVAQDLAQKLGPFPAIGDGDKRQRDDWTTRAVVDQLWQPGLPDLTVLWLAEPDFSQHATGPGSPAALRAIENSDTNLGRVLAALDQRGERDATDVLVVSDHAFSTIGRTVDLAAELTQAGWTAGRELPGEAADDTVLVVGNGNVVCLYVVGHRAETIRRLAGWLQTRDFTGVVFLQKALPGTFSLAQAHIDTPDAPDIVVSLRWDAGTNAHGVPGLATSEGFSRKAGQGNHTSLSRFDVHNTLVAAGPDFRRGIMDTLPTANYDVAPTILALLGVSSSHSLDGRVLSEALKANSSPVRVAFDRLAATVPVAGGTWSQYLRLSAVDGVEYLDEGNGELDKTAPSDSVPRP